MFAAYNSLCSQVVFNLLQVNQMPKLRESEPMHQKQPTRGPPHVRTSSSNSDPPPPRLTNPRSPKLGDRRSPRGSQSDPANKKKLGTRISNLESRLGEAQEELKKLKDQLASAEAAKKKAQEELENKIKKPKNTHLKNHSKMEIKESDKNNEIPEEKQKETDVFEVPMEVISVDSNANFVKHADQEAKMSELSNDLALKKDEISFLEDKLKEKEKELELTHQEHEVLKKDLTEAREEISSAQSKEQENKIKLTQLEEQLEASKENAGNLHDKLEEAKSVNEELEVEMKKLRVQTEQWRKAADAAAAVLAGDMDMKGRKISDRCGSMDTRISAGGYTGFVGSPGIGDDMDDDDGFGNGKKKGSGIKKFGDLWKKKGHK